MQSVTKFFKEENDFLYRKGFKKGFESTEYGKWAVSVIKNLITELSFPDEKIARVFDLPISFVKSVRDGLNK